jgi:hypothetical protein
MDITAKLGGTPKTNKFEMRHTVQSDAIRLEIVARNGVKFGKVHCTRRCLAPIRRRATGASLCRAGKELDPQLIRDAKASILNIQA